MIYTVKQFKSQNAYWHDKFYHYAIHITDGGAIYLHQVESPLKKKSVENIIRLDGCNISKLFENIKEVTNSKDMPDNAVLKKALELACDFAGLDTDKWSKEFIEQAKESEK